MYEDTSCSYSRMTISRLIRLRLSFVHMNPELKFTERFWDVLKENLLSAVLLH